MDEWNDAAVMRHIQDKADAARYRWLRDVAYHATAGPNGKMVWCVTGEGCSTEEPIHGAALDAAIDATMMTPNVPHEGAARASCAGPLDAVVGRHRE